MTVASIPSPGADELLVLTVDALVEGVHFAEGTSPEDVAYKSLAVNLSDLAAMAAEPLAAQFAWSDPGEDAAWRGRFEAALAAACEGARVSPSVAAPVPGPRRICVQALGRVPRGAALRRDGARAGDDLWMSGTLGDAAAALALGAGELTIAAPCHRAFLLARLRRPTPRVALGMALRGIARGAIDVSDGLVGDLGHIVARSGLAARVDASRLPLSKALRAVAGDRARSLALAGGDDYELCFTAAPADAPRVRAAARRAGTLVTRIGRLVAGDGVTIVDQHGDPVSAPASYQHFAEGGP